MITYSVHKKNGIKIAQGIWDRDAADKLAQTNKGFVMENLYRIVSTVMVADYTRQK